MSELSYTKLSDDAIQSHLSGLEGWSVENEKLKASFSFKTYKDGVVFANVVAFVADELNHHPDLLIGYGKVEVSVNTHDANGLTTYDFELARRIERIRNL